MGPGIEAWGTPQDTVAEQDEILSTETDLCCRFETNQSNTSMSTICVRQESLAELIWYSMVVHPETFVQNVVAISKRD